MFGQKYRKKFIISASKTQYHAKSPCKRFAMSKKSYTFAANLKSVNYSYYFS